MLVLVHCPSEMLGHVLLYSQFGMGAPKRGSQLDAWAKLCVLQQD